MSHTHAHLHPGPGLSLQRQRIGRRMFVAFLLAGIFPLLASLGVLTINQRAADGGSEAVRLACIAVVVLSATVIAGLAFKILHDIALAFQHASSRIRELAEGRLPAAETPPPYAPAPLPPPADSATEEQEISVGLNLLTDRLRGTMEELQLKARALEATNQQLKRLDRLKSDFLASVSHELRTPLTSIRSFSEILLTYEDEDRETRRRFLTIINKESERLTNLINDVLDLARIESGRAKWNLEVLDPRELAERARQTAEPLAAARQLALTVAAVEPLPSLFGDRDRLVQVLLNLLANAIKFSPPGQEVRLELAGEEGEEDELRLAVSDRGPGIPPERLPMLFDKFAQVHQPGENRPAGSGLGLAISREIAEFHGGRIEVQSAEGLGSTFTVRLPVWRGTDRFFSFFDWKRRQAQVLRAPLAAALLRLPAGDYTAGELEQLIRDLSQAVGERDLLLPYRRPGHLAAFLFADAQLARRLRGRLLEALGAARLPGRGPLRPAEAACAIWTQDEDVIPRSGGDIFARLEVLCSPLEQEGAPEGEEEPDDEEEAES